jgi:SMC interacting uncharacterized protein involved in chromosome segregation
MSVAPAGKQDPRPIKEKSWQKAATLKVIKFMVESGVWRTLAGRSADGEPCHRRALSLLLFACRV